MSAIVDPVSDVLGLMLSGPLPLISAVEEGLPLTSLDRVVGSVAPSDHKFAFRIVPRATLARRRKSFATAKERAGGRRSAEEGTRLTRLASVWAMALDVWGSGDAARQFLFEAHPLLHGRRRNILINDAHPEARRITHGPRQPIRWGRRLFHRTAAPPAPIPASGDEHGIGVGPPSADGAEGKANLLPTPVPIRRGWSARVRCRVAVSLDTMRAAPYHPRLPSVPEQSPFSP